jgi:PIN domain nuclease of toxin-antitoxin system
MRLLLDSCTFLWLFGQRAGLPDRVGEAISDPDNACFL